MATVIIRWIKELAKVEEQNTRPCGGTLFAKESMGRGADVNVLFSIG